MDNSNPSEAPLVPPVVDEAEFIQAPVIEAEPEEEELNVPLNTVSANGTDTSIPLRPGVQRAYSVPPAPLHLPPPAPPAPPPDQPPESLTLEQLQSIVKDLPRVEPTPYAFTYKDASSFEDELEEWFSYSVEEQAMLLKAQASFEQEWSAFNGISNTAYVDGDLDWAKATQQQKRDFMQLLLDTIRRPDPVQRLFKLEALVYILLGCWYESAGLPSSDSGTDAATQTNPSTGDGHPTGTYHKSFQQVQMIRSNVRLFVENDGLQAVMDVLRSSCLRACGVEIESKTPRNGKEAESREVWCAMTSMSVVLEVARDVEKDNDDLSIRSAVLGLQEPGLLMHLLDIIAKLRWDDSISLPLTKICLLVWKTMMVTFGSMSEVDKAKDSFKDQSLDSADAKGQPIITASPLDYHLFRQEILSKYPAYNPPPPLFPLEPENNSILPPLKNHPNKATGNHVFGSGLGDTSGNNTSIFHQPVHIATPAPSPPPSPAGPGGRGGKKQNYQTNQMFPFLYPPLDESSNKLGGKGSTDLQDLLVGRKWEGPDIPSSILEAADLFSKRMRATRAMKQLWDERVQFMIYERGWSSAAENADVNELSLEPKEGHFQKEQSPSGSIEERMSLVETFYQNSLPILQSVIIVLVKAILSHVTALVTQASGPNGLQSGFQFQDQVTNGGQVNGVNGQNGTIATDEELDTMRMQEILDKAVSGILILILKWFKVSHILKFEYITQLLVDSSYVPLILKLLQLQEIERVVNSRCEQEELNFFYFCRSHSRIGVEQEKPEEQPEVDSDLDDAVPPPIRMTKEDPSSPESEVDPSSLPVASAPPEVDELGFPTNEVPKEPITNFSWRAFFTSINYMRIMQKMCKNKAHRNLMLVSYKSSQFLRKNLKVPQPELRLYTLKLFKNQVPYCGRKWRQSNMRVITAVYLHCRPELRDDWLAGSDVDAEVDESVPLEQALRALTHWHNLKRYPEGMGAAAGVLGEEQDFFRRELEKMDWGEELDPDLEPVSVDY